MQLVREQKKNGQPPERGWPLSVLACLQACVSTLSWTASGSFTGAVGL